MAKSSLVSFALLSEEEQYAVTEAVKQRLGDRTHCGVRYLKRFGFTGATLLRVLPQKGRPFVAKVHRREEIKNDEQSIQEINSFFDDALQGFEAVYEGAIGVLIYPHFGANTAEEVDSAKELRDVAYDPECPIETVTTRIKELYEKASIRAHQHSELTEVDLRQEYRRKKANYLRTGKSGNPLEPFNSTGRIKAALTNQSRSRGFEYLGATIDNPIEALEKGFASRLKIKKGPVHGDLHPSNVIFAPGIGEPHLIDFSWAHKDGHLMKDFVLMETSLRFMLFPRPVCLKEQLRVDTLLLEPEGYKKILKDNFADEVTRRAYKRMAKMIEVIRNAAKPYLNSSVGFDEYLAAQFLILFGLLRYDSYDFYVGLRALGLITKHLRKNELIK